MAKIALRVTSCCVLLALLLCAPVRICFAQSEPDQVLRDLMAQIKEKGTAAPLIEAVDWESAFKKFEPWQLNNLKLKTPEDLKEYNRKFLEDPARFIEEFMVNQVANSKVAQETDQPEQLQKMIASMVMQVREQQKNLARIEYEVGGSKIVNDEATVPLTVSLDNRQDQQNVQLKNIGGKWMLTDILNFGKVLSAGPIAPPAGPSSPDEGNFTPAPGAKTN